jgi:hypothetical protein
LVFACSKSKQFMVLDFLYNSPTLKSPVKNNQA